MLLCLIIGHISPCQQLNSDSVLVCQIITRINYLQQNHDEYFAKGLIPSYREYHHNKGIIKNDDNIFYTGMVVFTLHSVYPYLDKSSRTISDSIFAHAAPLYAAYQNHSGRPTYNFWRTDKPEIFPNSGWLNLFNKSQALPDDLDDTVIILLASNGADSTVAQAHQLMQGFTNSNRKRVKSSLADYEHLHAYSTWFGKKMPVDLDFCVLTNILYLVHKYQLPYTAADSASLEMIKKVIENRHYMKAASLVSPHYNRTPLLLYHLSRLMAETNIPALEKWRPQLIQDATATYKHTTNFMDKLILSTALLRWGVVLPDETLSIETSLETFTENSDFVFFIANITSMFPKPFNKWLGRTGIGKFYYYCPAWNLTLLVENITWRNRVVNDQR